MSQKEGSAIKSYMDIVRKLSVEIDGISPNYELSVFLEVTDKLKKSGY